MSDVTYILNIYQFSSSIQGYIFKSIQNGLQQLEYVLECLLWSDGCHDRFRELSFYYDSLEAKASQTSSFPADQSGHGRPSGRTNYHTNVHYHVVHSTGTGVVSCFWLRWYVHWLFISVYTGLHFPWKIKRHCSTTSSSTIGIAQLLHSHSNALDPLHRCNIISSAATVGHHRRPSVLVCHHNEPFNSSCDNVHCLLRHLEKGCLASLSHFQSEEWGKAVQDGAFYNRNVYVDVDAIPSSGDFDDQVRHM